MKTTIIVSYDVGWGNHLAIRGGVPLSWDSGTAMDPIGASTWRLELDLDGPLEFKPCLNDEVWCFGRRDYRVEPGEVAMIHPHFLGTPGWAEAIGYIPFKGRDLSVRLYTPPGYKENAGRRYPVVYCLDGQSLFENRDWPMEEHLNALVEARVTEPLMVVGVDFVDRGPDMPHKKPIEAEGKAGEFATFVLKLKETVDRNYPTLSGPSHTGVLGASLGGLFALWLGRHHPETFGRVAAMSPSFWWDDGSMLQNVQRSEGHNGQRIYLDSGTGDDEGSTPQNVKKVAAALAAEGWVEGDDLRTEFYERARPEPAEWANRIGVALQFLFPWSGR